MQPQSANAHRHRFAWLKPLNGNDMVTGSWVMSENHTAQRLPPEDDGVSITANALLMLLARVFSGSRGSHVTGRVRRDNVHSQCLRFSVRWHQQDSDTSRLFIQQRSDYFTRVELIINGKTIVAFQEPVWPHLQPQQRCANERLVLPKAAVHFLESLACPQSSATMQAPNTVPPQDVVICTESDDGTAAA